jgi:hypothetical protein
VLPLLSRAVLVTVVVPTGKVEPLAGILNTFVTMQLSVVVTANVTLLEQAPGAAFTVIFVAQTMTGGSVSWIVAALVQLPMQPTESTTCTVRLKVPEGAAFTTTDGVLVAPTMVPSPTIDH